MIEHLTREDRLAIFWKVNELCSINPRDFDPEKHVLYAEEIVRTLDGVLEPSQLFQVKVCRREEDRTLGYISEVNESRSSWGVKGEEEIGGFVVTKYQRRLSPINELFFDHFWDRYRRNLFDRGSIGTLIAYNKYNKDILKIMRLINEPYYLNFGSICFSLSFTKKSHLWKKAREKNRD